MIERRLHHPNPVVFSSVETYPKGKTYFEILMVRPNGSVVDENFGLNGRKDIKIRAVKGDLVFFDYDDPESVLLCSVKTDKEKALLVNHGLEYFAGYRLGSHADTWFNNVLNTTNLITVARVREHQK